MPNLFRKTDKKLYPKILFSFVILIAVFVLILTMILYVIFERITLETTNSYIGDNLNQISYSAEIMNKTSIPFLMQINGDAGMQSLLLDSLPEGEDLYQQLQKMRIYLNSIPYIHSIYILNRTNNLIFDSGSISYFDEFNDEGVKSIVDNFHNYKVLAPIPRVIKDYKLNSSGEILTNVYTYVFFSNQWNIDYNRLDKAIVINIREDWIKEMINSMNSNKDSKIYIIDSKGILLESDKSSEMLTDLSSQAYIGKILSDNKPRGYFVDNVAGRRFLVSYVSSSVLSWKFICLTPYEIIMKKISELKSITILVCFIILILGLLISYFLSKVVYSPIRGLLDNLSKLQVDRQSNILLQKNTFLKNLVQAEVPMPEMSMAEIFGKYKVNFNPNDRYRCILLKIDHYQDFLSKYSYKDRNLLKFGIINISSELMEKSMKIDALDMDDENILLLVNISDSAEAHALLKEIIKQIIDSVQNYLGISLTVSISTPGSNSGELNARYNEAVEAAQYRIYAGFKSIIEYEHISEEYIDAFSYPVQKESKLIDALMYGNSEEVKAIFNEILEKANAFSCNSFRLTLTRLATAINIAVDSFEKNSCFFLNYDFANFISNMNKLEYIDEIRDYFHSLFDHILLKLSERKGGKHEEIVAKAIDLINSNYQDINLTQEKVADMLGVSVSYLRKLFKTHTSKTVAEYITQTRMDISKKLLSSTEYTINEITEKIGLTYSNYFFKLFKKTYGMTPNEYKKNIALHKDAAV